MLRRFVPILVAALAWPASCLALSFPPAMTPDELRLKSDLVALVRVLSVTCTAAIEDPETKQSLPTGWSAELEFLIVKKGSAQKGDIVTVSWSDVPKPVAGGSFHYYPGEEAWTHLVRAEVGYESTWWNAKGIRIKEPETIELPTKPGETIKAGTNAQTRK